MTKKMKTKGKKTEKTAEIEALGTELETFDEELPKKKATIFGDPSAEVEY